MSKTDSNDAWNSGDAYEPYVGRWSRFVADRVTSWLDVPKYSRWLDVGCGTCALTAVILNQTDRTGIMAVDPANEFIAHARNRVSDTRIGSGKTSSRCSSCFVVARFTRSSRSACRSLMRAARMSCRSSLRPWESSFSYHKQTCHAAVRRSRLFVEPA